METYTTSFTYPRRSRCVTHYATSFQGSTDSLTAIQQQQQATTAVAGSADADAVQKLAMAVMSLHACNISYFPAQQNQGWNFHISGEFSNVMAARALILREGLPHARATVKVARSEILDTPSAKPSLKQEVRVRLDEIASQTMAHIAVVNSPLTLSARTPPDGITHTAGWSGLDTERVCEFVVTGHVDSVEMARVLLLVLMDELTGLKADLCEIDIKLHAAIAGRKRHTLQNIMEETCTNIYLPSPLQGLVGPDLKVKDRPILNPGGPPLVRTNLVWITGEEFGITRARDMLFSISNNKRNCMISRATSLLPRKLDWMITERADDVRAIMEDNATYIQFSKLGFSNSLVTVLGDNRVNIQRTIRAIMELACQFYVASFWLLPVQLNPMSQNSAMNATQITALTTQVSSITGAEVVSKGMSFEMFGLEDEVTNAVKMIQDFDAVKAFQHEIRFQIELSNEHRDFISGKKNGKINKIMQTASVKIKFETFNDQNFVIDLTGTDTKVLQGLTLLREELPAEISFHVPEAYHKRIIGVAGKSIQRIMKKFGVYVKFSNAEEFALLGGYHENEDNVIARTPAKNAASLEHLKQSVMELVSAKDKDYLTETIAIPRRYHRELLGEKSIFIHDIEKKTNCQIRFPHKESGSDIVMIFGPESQVQIAGAMLLEHVPFEADMTIPTTVELPRVMNTREFQELLSRINKEMQVEIQTVVKATSKFGGSEAPPEYSFKFCCRRSNTDFLNPAREILEEYLIQHNVRVHPSSTTHVHKRGDSFTEAFPHFDSKVLSAAAQGRSDFGRHRASVSTHMTHAPALSTDFSRLRDSGRRLRMANSSPDVKAMFNRPAYLNSMEEPEDTEEEYQNELDFFQEEYEDSHPHESDAWTPLPPIGFGVHRSRNSEDVLKRGSDSLLDSKMRDDMTNPRSLTNRAQSLDLSFAVSRKSDSSNRYPRPDSPADFGEEFDARQGPAPLFPSVYTPPNPQNGHGNNRDGVDDVSRMVSSLGL